MINTDSVLHVRGASHFIDDFTVPEGTLHAAVYTSPHAHARIVQLDISDALRSEGVRAVFTARDIPGENQIGSIKADEPLLAEGVVEYIGQPVALVVAADRKSADAAIARIACSYEVLEAVFDPVEAFRRGMLIIPPRVFSCGDTVAGWDMYAVIVEGTAASGGQEHLYLETQGAVAIPKEGDAMTIRSATQNPSSAQKMAARVLGVPAHLIHVEVPRLGGGFGGKEDQATPWAVLAALASHKLHKPVKLVLSREEDMRITGKRHPYFSEYRMGLNKEGKILAYEVTFYQNAGAAADLSPAILDRTLFHTTNAYFIPNVRAAAYSCKTNLPPNTAFRGFGAPQAMFVLEAAIHKAARALGMPVSEIQQKNLLFEGAFFPYGQQADSCNAQVTWSELRTRSQYCERVKNINTFNNTAPRYKKGLALMPICFGISFTTSSLNQAGALVHIYADGSVGISTGAVEMGQGVHSKIRLVAAEVLGIPVDLIRMETTHTATVANTSPTAASSGADLNGKAVEAACTELVRRLHILKLNKKGKAAFATFSRGDDVAAADAKAPALTWKELISEALSHRIDLSVHAHYVTPKIFFNKDVNKGSPFAYYVYGAALIEVTVDALLGTYAVNSVEVVHDTGKSLDTVIDRGQAEGAIMQGIGWMTMEELLYASDGRLLADTLSSYKVPGIHDTPENFVVHFLSNAQNPRGLLQSKAIGEPPFMYGIAAFFAIASAIESASGKPFEDFCAPMTPERVLLNLLKT